MNAAPNLKLVPMDARPEPEPQAVRLLQQGLMGPWNFFSAAAAPRPAAGRFWRERLERPPVARKRRCAAAPRARKPYGPIQLHPLPTETYRARIPSPHRRQPVRVEALHAYVPRRQRPGARPKTQRLRPLSEMERRQLARDEAELRELGILPRPKTLAECQREPGPCPLVGCSNNLYLDVNPRTGVIKYNFPDKEVWELEETCALRVAERGGATLDEVGRLLNLTQERVSQLERIAQAKMEEDEGLAGAEPAGRGRMRE